MCGIEMDQHSGSEDWKLRLNVYRYINICISFPLNMKIMATFEREYLEAGRLLDGGKRRGQVK